MPAKLYLWTLCMDGQKSSLAKSLGLVEASLNDSLLGLQNGLNTEKIRGLLEHSVAGSAHGSLRILNCFRDVTGLSFGHASIQLTNDYIGYWPAFNREKQCTSAENLLVEKYTADAHALMALSQRDAAQEAHLARIDEGLGEVAELTPYEQELLVMGRRPTHTIELPQLDEEAMSQYYRTEALHKPFAERTHNCCTVAHAAIFKGLAGMEKKMGFWDRLEYEATTSLRAMFRPLQTTQAIGSKVGGEFVVWNPDDLRIVAEFLRAVALR